MKNFIPKNSQLPSSGIQDEFRRWKLNPGIIRTAVLALLLWLPIAASAAFSLPAIPSNGSLAKRFELSTELVFRVKIGETYLPSGALIASINGEIRGAQTASVNFPATGINVYKILVFNDKSSGDSISFKYYDIFSEKIYDIKQKIEFIPNLIPDYSNPAILTAYCKPITIVTGLIPENAKENQNSTLDLFWQPSANTSYYNLFVWEDGTTMPVVPTNSNIFGTTFRLYNLKYGQLYRWKIGSVNDCSSVESAVQTFKVRQLPDLTVNLVTAPANIESANNFTINFKIKNAGGGNTAGAQWWDAIYASTDQTISNDDRLLTSKINGKQLEADSTYSQSVSVSFPIDVTGDFYFLVKTDIYNSVVELSEDNNLGKTAVTTHVAQKSLPDILVKDIQPGSTNINPGDSLTVSWKVQNIAGVPAVGGWIEKISLIPVSGLKLTIDPSFEYDLDLAAGATVNRSKKIKLPDLLKFSGNANIEVELLPLPALVEYPASKANNKTTSVSQVTVGNLLKLDIQTASALENTPSPIRCIITRSGDYSADLVVSLSASMAGQLTIPATVTIPANQSSVVFNLSTINNLIIDGPRNVDISASATDYTNSTKTITVLDDEIPGLKAQLSKSSATEGETITLTVTRDLVTSSPLPVNISTNKSSQWTFSSGLIIPANQASADITVSITDDNIPELTSDATIYASSAGLTTGQVTASIIDNDIPEVSFQILTDTVSESAGVYATWGVVKRVKGSDIITVNLTANLSDQLFFPASVVLPKGVQEQKFNIGVVDNAIVDGYRRVTLTGSVFISSCNCRTTAQNGGVVTADLVIADNDGPSLSVSVDPISLPEGKLNAGTLTITRNTPTTLALDVNISYNDTSQVKIQPSATILAGQRSVQVPINTKNDHILVGTQMASIQASAPTFTTGFGYVFVTDQNKPDLQITDIALNTNTAATNEVIEISGSAFNGGFATAPSGVVINFYSSKDKTLDASDILLGDLTHPSPILQGAAANFLKTVNVPAQTGNYYILAKINPAETLAELVYFNNVSDAVPLTITPEYNATVIADNILYQPNTTISLHGSAVNNKSEKVPNADVDVYILNNGTRRELKAKTNSSGDYTIDFAPIPNESGHYSIGACFPKQNLSAEQDKFDIPGLQLGSTSNIIWDMKQGQFISGKIAIKNTSEAALNKLVITPDKLPLGCDLKFDTIAVLSGNQTKEFSFTLKALEITSGKDYQKINFQVKSSEGITVDFPAFYYCQALQAQLNSDPV
ncbi:MAG: CARDB domain-containing protein, partial [Bacteroidia bacterium]